MCREKYNRTVCSCLTRYIGNPLYGCHKPHCDPAKCHSNEECRIDEEGFTVCHCKPDIFSTVLHLVAFNVKLNSIVSRTKLATNEEYVLIHAFAEVSVVQVMIVMCSIIKQVAAQKAPIRHALPTLIVLHTKLVMGTNVLIRV